MVVLYLLVYTLYAQVYIALYEDYLKRNHHSHMAKKSAFVFVLVFPKFH